MPGAGGFTAIAEGADDWSGASTSTIENGIDGGAASAASTRAIALDAGGGAIRASRAGPGAPHAARQSAISELRANLTTL